MFDENGRYVRVNQYHTMVTGYSEAEILKMNPLDFFLPKDHAYIIKNLERLFSEGKAASEATLLTRDGRQVPYFFNAVTQVIDGRKYAMGLGLDLSEKSQLENQLRQAQKMEAIGALASGIAHDFNNILGAIFGFTQLVMDKTPRESNERHRLEKVLQSSQRAKELVSQILMFSRPSDTKKENINVVPVINETVKFIRATLPTTIQIRACLTVTNDRILADPTRIHQIVMNLCTNAKQAMAESGGILELHLADSRLDKETTIDHVTLPPGKYMVFTVKDTGCGIPETHLAKIFDPYFTTKKKGDGTGLGLSIVYGIVKEMGGAVQAESKEGQGTTFRIYFPVCEQVDVVKESGQMVSAWKASGHHIMIVDDETDLIEAYGALLRKMGYQVTAFDESPGALRAFADNPNGFDIVVTDYTMPEMTGTQLAEALIDIRPDLPVILCSGTVDETLAKDARCSGIADVLAKPLEKQLLAMTLAKHLKAD